jgi:hypothetical protein
MGFNTASDSRNVPFPIGGGGGGGPDGGRKTTFNAIVQRLQRESLGKAGSRCVLLNPVVGPEAITASSRMKVLSLFALNCLP